MVCGWEDAEWGGEVPAAGRGAEGEEWGSAELGSVEFVIWFFTLLEEKKSERGRGFGLVYMGGFFFFSISVFYYVWKRRGNFFLPGFRGVGHLQMGG